MAFLGENFVHMWINFDHDTLTVRDSYNIASVDDVGTGRLRFNFSTNAANVNYCFSGVAGNATSTTGTARFIINDDSFSVSNFRIRYRYNQGVIDDSLVSIICVGES